MSRRIVSAILRLQSLTKRRKFTYYQLAEMLRHITGINWLEEKHLHSFTSVVRSRARDKFEAGIPNRFPFKFKYCTTNDGKGWVILAYSKTESVSIEDQKTMIEGEVYRLHSRINDLKIQRSELNEDIELITDVDWKEALKKLDNHLESVIHEEQRLIEIVRKVVGL